MSQLLCNPVLGYDCPMPSGLNRYQNEGSYHFLTFSCYRRLPFLNEDHGCILFEEALEVFRERRMLSPNFLVSLADRPGIDLALSLG